MGTYEGYDAREDVYVNMVEKGIVDPTKVVRCASAVCRFDRRTSPHHRSDHHRRRARKASSSSCRRRNGLLKDRSILNTGTPSIGVPDFYLNNHFAIHKQIKEHRIPKNTPFVNHWDLYLGLYRDIS